MYHIKEDQRSIRSGEMIFDGLAALMQEKDFAAITVTDVVHAAGVGRTTFYRNFDEIEDVLRMRCDQVVEGVVSYLQTYRQQHPEESRNALLKPLLRYFYLHSELIELLIKAKRIHMFEEAILSHFEPFKGVFSAYYGMEADYAHYVMVMRIGGITNVLIHWIATGKKHAPDELADKLSALTTHMVALEELL